VYIYHKYMHNTHLYCIVYRPTEIVYIYIYIYIYI